MAIYQESASSYLASIGQAAAVAGPSMESPLHREPYVDDDIDETFEDAAEEHVNIANVDLLISFTDCEVAIKLFFNNDWDEALDVMKPWCRTSLYHSLGMSIFEFIPAILTYHPLKIRQALVSFKNCILVCNKNRRNYSFVETLGTIIKKTDYGSFTDLEAHAELCYAEVLLLQALLTILSGEDLTGLIKGTLKIKNCYNCYKDCAKILVQKVWESEESRVHFHSGVRLGLAAFNVFVSLLPPKLISVLEFVGFTADKQLGLDELEEGSHSEGLRSVFCDLTLLSYHLVICPYIGSLPDLHICHHILNKQLQIYQNGVWFLLFKGRYEFLQGQFDFAITMYERAIKSQKTFPQFRHLCYWDMMWISSLRMDWREAAKYAGKLVDESTWSKTIYCYTKAACLVELGDSRSLQDLHHCNELMRNAILLKQRIAGKSLPMEKFVIRRCMLYDTQRGRLMLPGVELLCLWNMFPIIAKHRQCAQNLLMEIERTLEQNDNDSPTADSIALIRYLYGSLLAAMNLPRLAICTLEEVILLKRYIKEDTFLVPYTLTEIAMCEYQIGHRDRALQLLNEARKKYSGYALESRLHFRIHSKIEIVKNNIKDN